MNNNAYSENITSQQPAIELLQALGYTYISPENCTLQRGNQYDVLLKDVLRGQLRKLNKYGYAGVENEFSQNNIERAIEDLDLPLSEGLVRTSEKIYDLLLLGVSYPEIVGEGRHLSFNLKYIDWDNWDNNVFHVSQEFPVENLDKSHTARPDIVLFINGIPFAVIECKAPHVSCEQAVEQSIRNQKTEFVPQLFKYAQMVMATNVNEVKYATTGTPKKFWNVWKEEDTAFLDKEIAKCIDGRIATTQDKNIISLFSKERVRKLIKYFVLYDGPFKKICRYQQFFAIGEIVKTINTQNQDGNRQSGVVWHTQGSGKSLTMVMLAKYILMEMTDCQPKVVIVTDRKELDGQIATTFSHTRLNPATATSGRHLVSLINQNKADVITTIINKFSTAEKQSAVCTSKNVFVLVDESHRSNHDSLAVKMRLVFPNACYIGFTGTPLMKSDKSTVARFGKLIHKYTIKDGVDDGAIVPLIYEGRFVEQKVDEENIDLWFEQITKRMTDAGKKDLQRKWSSIKRLNSTDARIKRIALDINNHFLNGYKETGFKAMLATNRKMDAVRYLNCFEKFGDLECAVVISPPDMREGNEDIHDETDDLVLGYWNKMMKLYGDADRYEEAIKNKYQSGEIDILIVCSKLLTGFDAPLCQVLYIDKELKEHGLLQAIARTNRLREGKDYGMIVDYRGLIVKLDEAMETYSGAGLENFDEGDLKGAIVDVMSAISNLRTANTNLENMFDSLQNNRDREEIELSLADEKRREEFYNNICAMGRALAVVLNSESTYSAFNKDELQKYQETFAYFAKLRVSVKVRYFDAMDNAEYEQLMQNLLDTHMSVVGLKYLVKPVDILDRDGMEAELNALGSLRAKAEAMANKMTKAISEKYDENPAFYDSFSKRIKDALEEYKNLVITEAEYLSKVRSIMDDFVKGKTTIVYPELIKSNIHAQAFFGVVLAILSQEEDWNNKDFIAEISLEITNIIHKHSMVDWSENKTIHDRIAQDIDDMFFEYQKERGLNLSFDVVDNVIENVKTVALRRF